MTRIKNTSFTIFLCLAVMYAVASLSLSHIAFSDEINSCAERRCVYYGWLGQGVPGNCAFDAQGSCDMCSDGYHDPEIQYACDWNSGGQQSLKK